MSRGGRITVKIPDDLLQQLDALAERLTTIPGRHPVRGHAIVIALQLGIDAIERDPEMILSSKPRPKKCARKKGRA